MSEADAGRRRDRLEAGKAERREEVSENDESTHDGEAMESGRARPRPKGGAAPPSRIVVDKRTHRVRLENETESEVTIVIEERGRKG